MTNNRERCFGARMKWRIALQLVLDGMPFLFLLIFALTIYGLLDPLYHYAPMQWLGIICLYGFTYGSVPVFILAVWLRHRAAVDFACYPMWKRTSTTLRVLSGVALCPSLIWLFIVLFS